MSYIQFFFKKLLKLSATINQITKTSILNFTSCYNVYTKHYWLCYLNLPLRLSTQVV